MREYQFCYIAKFSLYSKISLYSEINHHSEMPASCFLCLNDSVLVFLLSTLIVIVLVRLVW